MAFSSLRKKSPSVNLVTTMFLLSMFLIHLFAWPYTRYMFNVWKQERKQIRKKSTLLFITPTWIWAHSPLPITYDGDTIYSILSAFRKVGFISLYQMLLQIGFFHYAYLFFYWMSKGEYQNEMNIALYHFIFLIYSIACGLPNKETLLQLNIHIHYLWTLGSTIYKPNLDMYE